MPQLHFSLDEETARLLARKAKAEGLSLSRYLARLVRGQAGGEWPGGYLEGVIGSCADAPLEEPPDLELDEPAT